MAEGGAQLQQGSTACKEKQGKGRATCEKGQGRRKDGVGGAGRSPRCRTPTATSGDGWLELAKTEFRGQGEGAREGEGLSLIHI